MSDADLAFAGAARQAELIRSGETTSRQLVELYLDRIARHDGRLNAFRVVLADRARDEADLADERAKAGGAGPLNGVPVAVKDDTDVKGEVTAKGSIAHGGRASKVDARIVRRLREAGAVIVGKTNVPELMTMPFTETVWYGATRNPWDLDRTPGGSSGGSAAAVAAGLVAAATGSDGAGSIRIPAVCCGLVGLKPSPGVVPGPQGWRGLSTSGFVTRTAADAALLYDAVRDEGPSYAEALTQDAPGLHVAWSVKVPLGTRSRVDGTQRRAVASVVETLKGLGHQISERDPELGFVGSNVIPRYLRGIADDARAMPEPEKLDRRSKGLARLGSLVPESLAAKADAAAAADRERIVAIFDDVDVLVLPVFTSMPLRIGAYEGLGGARSLEKALNYVPFPGIFNHIGLPAVAVPADATQDGFPLGVQMIGPVGSEARLLALAAQLERAVGWPARRPPGFDQA